MALPLHIVDKMTFHGEVRKGRDGSQRTFEYNGSVEKTHRFLTHDPHEKGSPVYPENPGFLLARK